MSFIKNIPGKIIGVIKPKEKEKEKENEEKESTDKPV